MDKNTILEKAKELGMMIAESEEFKQAKEAEQKQLDDPEAQKLMAEYIKRREELSERASNPDLTKEEYEKIMLDAQAEFARLCINENIKNYLDKNKEFSDLVEKVNAIIVHFVKGDDQSGCSGSCSGCSGCR